MQSQLHKLRLTSWWIRKEIKCLAIGLNPVGFCHARDGTKPKFLVTGSMVRKRRLKRNAALLCLGTQLNTELCL